MRLFAAVLPPVEAVAELGVTVDRLRKLPGSDGLRWTGRAGWHLTLAFMGEVDEGLLPELRVRLARAAGRTAPFPLRIRGGGHFGHRALWAGVAGGLDELRLLAERSDAAARRAGVAMTEHRRYLAHLTLARSRAEADLGPCLAELSCFEGTPWEVTELALVRSDPPVPGVPGARPRYGMVDSWPLGRS
ncbi:RNA 2',3'-cyclic phosphodiesterase [Streptomyces jumonjinensis]|uniref:RNA 2',3'-cyclic phosphodiesterase n=1 Tax=Streptomyces jumonjinensis TaxID=1945 RepID=A0A646KPN8_STRJU|nr:RNA 2',3'-cyclic phosphodiesterase [Streptomyces jumonjinensis]MQT04284.1 RNA 2',3'-cyclic phosphodiesterase [Streptomyces jumonjinensis]